MRRPLFPDGQPLAIVADGTAVTVFDTQDFDPDYVYLVTLYVWLGFDDVNGLTLPADVLAMASTVISSGGVGVPTSFYGVSGNAAPAALFTDILTGRNVEAPKLFDRVPVRGDQQLQVLLDAGGNTMVVFGYFEIFGPGPIYPERPLQPDTPVSPFNCPYIQIVATPGNGVSEVIHQLDSNYIDYFDLWGLVGSGLAYVGNIFSLIRFPNGVDIPIITLQNPDAVDGTARPFHILPNIPIRAEISTALDVTVEITNNGEAVDLGSVAWGTVQRVS